MGEELLQVTDPSLSYIVLGGFVVIVRISYCCVGLAVSSALCLVAASSAAVFVAASADMFSPVIEMLTESTHSSPWCRCL